MNLVYWALRVLSTVLEAKNEKYLPQHQQISNILKKILEKAHTNKFIIANLYIGIREDTDRWKKVQRKYSDIKKLLINRKYTMILGLLDRLPTVKADGTIVDKNKQNAMQNEDAEPITFCLQPFVAVNVLLNPNCSTKNYVSHLQMIQRLKNYSLSRVYCELIRSAMISLQNVSRESEISRESLWFAFTFIKVPYILKQLHAINSGE